MPGLGGILRSFRPGMAESLAPQAQARVGARSEAGPPLDVSEVAAPSAAAVAGPNERDILTTRRELIAREQEPNALLEKGITMLDSLPHAERGTSLLINDVGELLRECGRLGEAGRLFEEALAARRAQLGDADPMTLTSLNNLGLLRREEGLYDEATALLTEAYEARRSAQGEDHPETLTALNNLGALLKREGKYALAEPIYVRVLELRRAALGDEHPDTLTSINNMAMLLQAQGKLDAAEPLLFEAASTARRVLGIDHPHAKTFAVNLNTLQRQKMHGLQKDRLLVYTQPTEKAAPRKPIVRRRLGHATPNTTPRSTTTAR